MEKLVSVIVPVYNAEPYLEKCVGSILGQTYRNLEIILVNDGSTDRSPLICRKFAQSDPRVKLLQKENGGLVSARKAGLTEASGGFIGWVDADDWVEPDYFAQVMQSQEETGADIVACNHFHDIGSVSQKVVNKIPPGLYEKDFVLQRLIASEVFFEFGLYPSLCTNLIRREILEKTQTAVDDRILLGEDVAVVYPSVLEADKIAVTEICGYHYVQHQGSMMKTSRRNEPDQLKLLLDHLENVFRQKGVMDRMRPQLERYEKFVLLIRQIEALDREPDREILRPYGGIPPRSRVVIYGAGGLGQQIYQYLTGKNLAQVALWADRNYAHYQKGGMDVRPPEDIGGLGRQYDCVLIAVTLETTAESIRAYLRNMQVPEEKIRWLSEDFLHGGA